jgi:hypothetical protein
MSVFKIYPPSHPRIKPFFLLRTKVYGLSFYNRRYLLPILYRLFATELSFADIIVSLSSISLHPSRVPRCHYGMFNLKDHGHALGERYVIAQLRHGIIKFRRNAISRIHHGRIKYKAPVKCARVLLSRNSQFTVREKLIQFTFNISHT